MDISESLLSTDSDTGDDEDFTQVNATTKHKEPAWNEDESPAKRTRRNFDISPKVLKEALLGCGGRDAQTGVACGTVAEVTEYVAKQQGLTLDRALHNAVYQRLRNGKDWECSKRDGGRKEKMVYYLKGTLPAKANAAPGGGGVHGLTISAGSSSSGGSSTDKSSAGVPSQAFAVGSPRMTPSTGGGSKSVTGSAGGSSHSKASAKTTPISLPMGVPHFGGSEGHRCYFHAEALERGLRRANATLAKLGESTGLHRVLGELDVEVLTTDSCDEARWATMLGWHAKYERMRAVFLGSKDHEVEGYRFVLVLNCRSGGGATGQPRQCDPVSVASVTPHRVYNLPEKPTSPRASTGGGGSSGVGGASKEHWHVELEIQTLLVPAHHQGRGIGTVMQRAMYVLAQGLAAEPDPPTSYDDDDPPGTWKATHSPWIGRRVTRRASNLNQDNGQGDDLGVVRGVVEAWLPAHESCFLDARGQPAPLWRVRYTTAGSLEGELEDLEEHELLSSVPPDLAPSSDDGGVLPTTTSSGAAITTAGDDDDNDKRSNSHTQRYQAAAQLLTNPAEELDAQEAVKISLERITCTTTVYLDDMARKFYLKNDMKEMLPPYDDQGGRRGAKKGCAPRARIWDNCDHKRLHWWYNTIWGSSFTGTATPEESLREAIANTVESCRRGPVPLRE